MRFIRKTHSIPQYFCLNACIYKHFLRKSKSDLYDLEQTWYLWIGSSDSQLTPFFVILNEYGLSERSSIMILCLNQTLYWDGLAKSDGIIRHQEFIRMGAELCQAQALQGYQLTFIEHFFKCEFIKNCHLLLPFYSHIMTQSEQSILWPNLGQLAPDK